MPAGSSRLRGCARRAHTGTLDALGRMTVDEQAGGSTTLDGPGHPDDYTVAAAVTTGTGPSARTTSTTVGPDGFVASTTISPGRTHHTSAATQKADGDRRSGRR